MVLQSLLSKHIAIPLYTSRLLCLLPLTKIEFKKEQIASAISNLFQMVDVYNFLDLAVTTNTQVELGLGTSKLSAQGSAFLIVTTMMLEVVVRGCYNAVYENLECADNWLQIAEETIIKLQTQTRSMYSTFMCQLRDKNDITLVKQMREDIEKAYVLADNQRNEDQRVTSRAPTQHYSQSRTQPSVRHTPVNQKQPTHDPMEQDDEPENQKQQAHDPMDQDKEHGKEEKQHSFSKEDEIKTPQKQKLELAGVHQDDQLHQTIRAVRKNFCKREFLYDATTCLQKFVESPEIFEAQGLTRTSNLKGLLSELKQVVIARNSRSLHQQLMDELIHSRIFFESKIYDPFADKLPWRCMTLEFIDYNLCHAIDILCDIATYKDYDRMQQISQLLVEFAGLGKDEHVVQLQHTYVEEFEHIKQWRERNQFQHGVFSITFVQFAYQLTNSPRPRPQKRAASWTVYDGRRTSRLREQLKAAQDGHHTRRAASEVSSARFIVRWSLCTNWY